MVGFRVKLKLPLLLGSFLIMVAIQKHIQLYIIFQRKLNSFTSDTLDIDNKKFNDFFLNYLFHNAYKVRHRASKHKMT